MIQITRPQKEALDKLMIEYRTIGRYLVDVHPTTARKLIKMGLAKILTTRWRRLEITDAGRKLISEKGYEIVNRVK